MTAALERGEWSAARTGRTLPPGKDPVPTLQEAGCAPGPVWTGGKSLPNRDSIPDRPARSRYTETEMCTGNIFWGVKVVGAYGWQPYHLHVPIVLKAGTLNLLEPSGPVQACTRVTFCSYLYQRFVRTRSRQCVCFTQNNEQNTVTVLDCFLLAHDGPSTVFFCTQMGFWSATNVNCSIHTVMWLQVAYIEVQIHQLSNDCSLKIGQVYHPGLQLPPISIIWPILDTHPLIYH